ncbi:formin-binding protein 4 isoform X2 [Amyelois transitella]|uniref:formin-binding protein 4 isoform X2 n=1 Tax=Amyelois transitella TaxID=680683 RepID=UPI00298F7870|nr:formin-binding protein 4 isoform X2 [Amyelois transitella]
MNKANPLAGLIGYGDSDEDSDEEQVKNAVVPTTSVISGATTSVPVAMPPQAPTATTAALAAVPPGIHPAPVPYCPWSACYDESTGFTYYWNQQTNAVTWEAPPEYLLAVKIAQQQMSRSGSAEVSAEEWQLYQQALAEKQNIQNKAKVVKPATTIKNEAAPAAGKDRNAKAVKRRRNSDDEPVKIELITSYHNSDSESNDEESPIKKPAPSKVPAVQTKAKVPAKKPKKPTVEYGPALPPNMEYTIPIGPEMPPELISEKPKSPVSKIETNVDLNEEVKNSPKVNDEDMQDDDTLLKRLKDKARLLEKLGGEIPSELQKIIEAETRSRTASPRYLEENSRDSKIDTNIDELLDEIEKKELPKVKSKSKTDTFSNPSSQSNSQRNSPKSNNGDCTPPLEDSMKPLFPCSKNIDDTALFPSTANIKEEKVIEEKELKTEPVIEKKAGNMYLMDSSEPIENVNRKKLRISNSVLPERKKTEPVATPAYTTKYSQHIEGFSSERTGLGFTKEEDSPPAPKNTITYGNGLLFTKGEVLNNEAKQDSELDEHTDLVEAKLKYLNSLQVSSLSPVQEMLIQMQTLSAARAAGALAGAYWRAWGAAARAQLARLEAGAAPRGWLCVFQRSEGRYKYRRESDGFEQWEYPAQANTDMEICTTPPHPGPPAMEEQAPPPAPRTPPPPLWEPPPPGTDDVPPPPPPPSISLDSPKREKKQEIGDALLSFYNDIAELEKTAPPPPPAPCNPPLPPNIPPQTVSATSEPPPPPEIEERKVEVKKKKSKVKISASIGMKHKTVSSLVAKWQQVAEEINSD